MSILSGRYKLEGKPRQLENDDRVSLWSAFDEEENAPCLIKVWPFTSDHADQDAMRALWNAELRNLYRVASTPTAQDTLVRLRYATVDQDNACFVMVLQTASLTPLADLLTPTRRPSIPWLDSRDFARRRELWEGLRSVADGIRLLHRQRLLHRAISPESVFCNSDLDARSLRLGGFEWSVRLGLPSGRTSPDRWYLPPEYYQQDARRVFGQDTDWYAFGLLAARTLLPGTEFGTFVAPERSLRIYQVVRDTGRSHLTAAEVAFLTRLISPIPSDRVRHDDSVAAAFDDLFAELSTGRQSKPESRVLVLVLDPNLLADYIDRLRDIGFHPNSSSNDPYLPFNAKDHRHVAELKRFLERQFRDAQVFDDRYGKNYVLAGEHCAFHIAPYQSQGLAPNWDAAFVLGPGGVSRHGKQAAPRNLPKGGLRIFTRQEMRGSGYARESAVSWRSYLPRRDPVADLGPTLSPFLEFIRCMNQLELIIRSAEIYPILVERRVTTDDDQRLVIRERSRKIPRAQWCSAQPLDEQMQDELSSHATGQAVYLYDDEEDPWAPRPKHELGTRRWRVLEVDTTTHTLVLAPADPGEQVRSVSDNGWLRSENLRGQVQLISRRRDAIQRLKEHAYLLQAIVAPHRTVMDTRAYESLPHRLQALDLSQDKVAVLHDILRVLPIYALQGPPGTGKSTLVAHLIRQILTEDRVAQILVTAPSHEAVDVLRDKVEREAYRDVPAGADRPIAIRLHKRTERAQPGEEPRPGSIEAVAREQLRLAHSLLRAAENTLSPLERDWLGAVTDMRAQLQSSRTASSEVNNFMELIKLSANLTYSTTSSGDLEELAKGAQSFDWTVVEEAGKSHGFDLALPLQAGHRWLLIGDQRQLPPYLIQKYMDGLDDLPHAVELLEELPPGARNLVDTEWLREWRQRAKDGTAEEFRIYAKGWAFTFAMLFENCKVVHGQERVTGQDVVDTAGTGTLPTPNGAAVGILRDQHRMHPVIGQLVSDVFYRASGGLRSVKSATDESVSHPLVAPLGIAGKSIVWIDHPLAIDAGYRRENSLEVETVGKLLSLLRPRPGFQPTSDDEKVEIAILSPYRAQVRALSQGIRVPPSLLEFARIKRKGESDPRAGQSLALAHTVDEFQGNQSQVVVVSLTRNINGNPGRELGFLDPSRTNVLLSRAKSLLVLVGSWDFFSDQVSLIPSGATAVPLFHWRATVDALSALFDSGDAIRLPVAELSS